MYKVWVVLIASLLGTLPVSAADEDNMQIYWYHADFPPGFIKSGPLQGQGYENYLEGLLRDNLDEYQHHYTEANYGRILSQIKQGQSCCVALRKTKAREAFVVYSEPTMAALANGVFVPAERIEEYRPYIDDTGSISLTALTANTDLVMGVAKGRSYGKKADDIISQLSPSQLFVRSGEDVFAGLLQMASKHRSIDYLLGFPHELMWLKHQAKVESEFTFIPIQEMPAYTLSYVGCSRGEWGDRVIERINKVLALGLDPEYKRRYQAFLPDEAIAIHNQLVDELFTRPEQVLDQSE